MRHTQVLPDTSRHVRSTVAVPGGAEREPHEIGLTVQGMATGYTTGGMGTTVLSGTAFGFSNAAELPWMLYGLDPVAGYTGVTLITWSVGESNCARTPDGTWCSYSG